MSRGITYPLIVRTAFSPNDIWGTPSSQPVWDVRTNSIGFRCLEFEGGVELKTRWLFGVRVTGDGERAYLWWPFQPRSWWRRPSCGRQKNRTLIDSSGQHGQVGWLCEGCFSVLDARLEPTGVVHRHFITFHGIVGSVAILENFLCDAHCCCSSWEKGFLTKAGEKKVEVGSNQVIQFCEVGGLGDKGDRQTAFSEQWVLRGGRVVYIRSNLKGIKKKKKRGWGALEDDNTTGDGRPSDW